METTLKIFQEIVSSKLKNIKTLKSLEKDECIKGVLDTLREIYKLDLDIIPDFMLLRYGGKLLGYLASLGNTASQIRARRDAVLQAYEELLNGLVLENMASGVGATEARARAKTGMAEAGGEIILSEQEHRAYETILTTTATTISFLQSALRQKTNERINTPKFGEENNI